MLFEPAIAHAREHALSWSPPAIYEDVSGPRRDLESVKAECDRQVLRHREAIAAWLAEGDTVRSELSEAFASQTLEPGHLEALNLMIELVEHHAVQAGKRYAAQLKAAEKTAKHIRQLDRAAGDYFLRSIEKLRAQGDLEMEERSNIALFLRALRAEHDQSAGSGPIFETSDALRRYLESAEA